MSHALPLIDLSEAQAPRALHLVSGEGIAAWVDTLPEAARVQVTALGFKGEGGTSALFQDAEGRLAAAIGAAKPAPGSETALWRLASCPDGLPEGDYRLATPVAAAEATLLAAGWALGAYAFTRYKARKRAPARLVWPDGADRGFVNDLARATYAGRDLVNTPAADCGPAELAEAARSLAGRFGAEVTVIEGAELLARNYPAIHAVGRASVKAPRLIDLRHGDAGPKVTLVGKGVCFDSGGLDIKPASGMQMMKKDMGGAALALSLAELVLARGLPVRLRVLIPAVENMISGDAFRPMDVLATRAGKTVEVGNTDAEGRLILCDALAEAVSEQPDLVLDFATLTGAARVALGPDLPALFTRHDDLAEDLARHGRAQDDPMWRLPLWLPYRKLLDSKTAELSSTGESPFAGAITAALFLADFVPERVRWAHVDTYAWNSGARPGRPEGGEVLLLRALFGALREFVTR